LEEENNWTGKLPTAYSRAEALRTVNEPDSPDRIFVHPSGYLELRQTLIPLNRTIEKVGNSQVENEPEYRIESYQFGNGQVVPVLRQGTLREHFARAQFEALPDEEKISAPDFELMAAGVNLVTDQAFDLASEMESTGNEFEDIILGDLSGEKQAVASYNWQEQRSRNFAGNRKAIDPKRPEDVFGLIDSLPDYGSKTYEIVSKTTLERPEELVDRDFWSYSEAKDYLQSQWEDGWKELQIREVVEEEAAVL
jgi:hypothetical protein